MNRVRTVKALAERVGCSVSTAKKALRHNVIAREKDGSFDVEKCKQGIYAQFLRAGRGGHELKLNGNGHGDLIALKKRQLEEGIKLVSARRQLAEHEVREHDETLVKISAVRYSWISATFSIFHEVDRITRQVACQFPGPMGRHIEDEFHRMMGDARTRWSQRGWGDVLGNLSKEDLAYLKARYAPTDAPK